MKLLLPTLLFGVVVSALGNPLPATFRRLAAGVETRIVCFGDSITGVYYHTGSRLAYPDLVAQGLRTLFPRSPVQVFNAGVSGHTTVQALARMDKDVLSRRPHLVTVMFGMNDMVGVPEDTFAANLRAILRRSRAAGAEVLLCTQNCIFPTDPRRPPERLRQFTDIIRAVGAETRTPVADCYAEFARIRREDHRRWAVLLMGHDIHPTLDGHRIFAQLIIEQLTGKRLPLTTFKNSFPAIPCTLARRKTGKEVRVTAVGLPRTIVQEAFARAFPGVAVTVEERPVSVSTFAKLAAQPPALFASASDDLMLVSFPRQREALSDEQWMHAFFQLTYKTVPFGAARRQRDVVWVLPSVTHADLPAAEQDRERLFRRRAHAGDLGAVGRKPDDHRPAAALLADWLRHQANGTRTGA